jgi:alpha-ribazole phosphatase
VRRLYLVRHGEAEGSEGRAVGHLDLPLSQEGAARIEALAGSWTGPPPGRLYTSDLRRAADSARILAARLGCSPVPDIRLREISFGEWEGRSWDEIHERDAGRLALWGERWQEIAPPGGETFGDLTSRILAWYQEIEDETVVAVAHGGSLRALLTALLDLRPERAFEIRLDCARVSGVAIFPDRRELLFLNQDRF